MKKELRKENERRQRTLLASLLLSSWAPLATGIAVIMSNSITQLADFVRRTMEFLVLLLSWLVFRYIMGREGLTVKSKRRLERIVDLGVSAALGVSGITMFSLALFRFRGFVPGGNVYPGLAIAILGLFVNLWFWRRYSALVIADYNPIIDAQRQLYLAKVFVDICVISALSAVAFMPHHAITGLIDIFGSVAVAAYLVWSSFRMYNAGQKKTELLHVKE